MFLFFYLIFAVITSFCFNRRDRVVAFAAPRVAAQKAFGAEISAFDKAVGVDGFYHVLGAGGLIAAGFGQQRGDGFLVELDEEDKRGFMIYDFRFMIFHCFFRSGGC